MLDTSLGIPQIARASRLGLAAIAAAMLAAASVPAAAQDGTQLALFGWGKSGTSEPRTAKPRSKEPMFCPKVIVQPGTAALTVYERGKEGQPLAVQYQVGFSEYARECVDLGAEIGMRIGVAGRALIGPVGKPGQKVDVPIRFVVLDDKKNVLVSQVTKLQVVIPADQTGVTFTHVEELGSVPMSGNAFRKYELRIGFETKPGRGAQG